MSPRDLLGTWTLERTIDDRLVGEQLTVDGETVLTDEPDGRVRWAESGTLHRRGVDLRVSRVLFVETREDGWFVTFDDGRDFHPWAPDDRVVHPCGADTYAGRVTSLDDDHWTVEWDVTGPAKDYTMVSRLTRAQRRAPARTG